MLTLARLLDAVLRGDLGELGDILTQRFKAVETAPNEANWDTARYLEVLPTAGPSAVSEAERSAATQLRLKEVRLARMTLEASAGGRSRSPL